MVRWRQFLLVSVFFVVGCSSSKDDSVPKLPPDSSGAGGNGGEDASGGRGNQSGGGGAGTQSGGAGNGTGGEGAALCTAGLTRCGDACVDLLADSMHCRVCGNACASGSFCDTGDCVVWEGLKISNLRADWQVNSDGNALCGTEFLRFDYEQGSDDGQWGIRVYRDGQMVNPTSVRTWPASGTRSFGANVFGSMLSEKTYRFQLQPYRDGISGPLSHALEVVGPLCGNAPSQGRAQISAQFVLVSFSDFADKIPFTQDELDQLYFTGRTHAGAELSLDRFFHLCSSDRVGVHTFSSQWLTLPHPMMADGSNNGYCQRQLHQPSYRDQFVGYDCDTTRIATDSNAELDRLGIVRNAHVLNYVINGMGATGFGGSNRTYLGADAMLNSMEARDPLPYNVLGHEMLHSFRMDHANSYRNCTSGGVPTSFLGGNEGTNCDVLRYGSTLMGVGTTYSGLSGAQQLMMGYMKREEVFFAELPSSTRVRLAGLEVFGADLKLAMFTSPALPANYQLFVEYLSERSELVVSGSDAGIVRFGLIDLYESTGPGPVGAGKLGTDGQVTYLDDVSLREPGDSVALSALGVTVELLSEDSESVELSINGG